MTIYISPNPGKTSANEIALRAAQILLTHGAAVLMCKELCAECSTAGVAYLPQEECLERSDVILTIGGDGTILHEANLSLRYAKPILGINLGRCGFLATCEVNEMETKLSAVARGEFSLDHRMLLYVHVLGHDGWEGHALNDVVVTKGRLQQAIDFSIYCDDILVEHYRGDGVIVAGDAVLDLVGIGVGVDQSDDGDVQALGLLDGVLLALGVDDEESLGQTLHIAGATEVGLELSELLAEHCLLLLGQHCHATVLDHGLELLHAGDAGADGGKQLRAVFTGEQKPQMPRRLLENLQQRILRAEGHVLRIAENDDAHRRFVWQHIGSLPQGAHRVHGEGACAVADHRDVGMAAVFRLFAGGTHAAGGSLLVFTHSSPRQQAGKGALAAAGRTLKQQSMRKTPCRNIL